jgi:hypothetical protein
MSASENASTRPIILPTPCLRASAFRLASLIGNVPSRTSCLAVRNFGDLTVMVTAMG